MAKVKFTAFVADVRGRLGDWVWSFNRGVHYKKAYQPNPTQPNTYRQQQMHAFFADITQYWDNLSHVQQSLWDSMATMLSKPMSGYNAFLKLNMRLLAACHSDLGCIYSPPPTPSTPKFPRGFCVFPVSSTVTCISWIYPETTADYITCYFRLHCSFCNNFPSYGDCTTVGYRPSQRFVQTVRSDVLSIIHNHSWPTGARLYYKLRSIDKYGRQSPFSHEIKIFVP